MVCQDRQGTIAARATPAGTGAVAVVRLSGERTREILEKVVRPRGPDNPLACPRRMCTVRLLDPAGDWLDEALVVFFSGPRSYTGEDLAEIHCHGGEAVVESVMALLLQAGARPAGRGEFTRRAFENGKMDLSRAEAVLRVIEAGTREQLIAAQRLLQGEFARELKAIRQGLSGLLAHLEAQVDFPEEPEAVRASLDGLPLQLERIGRLLARTRRRVEPGCEVVIAGRPNVGKSSLINAVAGRRVAIVSEEPGTTRDAVSTGVVLAGMRVSMVDTAGSGEGDPEGQVEREAARVADEHIQRAAMLIWVTDPAQSGIPRLPRTSVPVLWLVNKADLVPPGEREAWESWVREQGGLPLSVLGGQGIDEFLDRAGTVLSETYGPADGVPVTTRQEAALERLQESVVRAREVLSTGQPELSAEDLRRALDSLGELFGESLEVDVLDLIFEEFCVGK